MCGLTNDGLTVRVRSNDVPSQLHCCSGIVALASFIDDPVAFVLQHTTGGISMGGFQSTKAQVRSLVCLRQCSLQIN